MAKYLDSEGLSYLWEKIKSFTNGFKRGALSTGTDLNNVTTQGVYSLVGGRSYTNAPATYGILEVVWASTDSSNTIYFQRLTTTNHIYYRYHSGTTWYSWITL